MTCRPYVGDGNHREQMAFNRLASCLLKVLRNIPERLTTAQRLGLPDPENHRFVWDLDLQEMYYYDGAWFLIGPGGSGLDELVKISGTDTTPDFLALKLIAGAGISLTPLGAGYETLRVDATGAAAVTGTYLDGGVAPGQLAAMLTGAPSPTVVPASAATNANQLAGFVVSTGGGNALVQYAGELSGVFGGLFPETEYFAAVAAGGILTTPPPAGNIRRKVGIAKDPTTLVIRIDADYLIQA